MHRRTVGALFGFSFSSVLLCFPVYDSFFCLSIRVWGHVLVWEEKLFQLGVDDVVGEGPGKV